MTQLTKSDVIALRKADSLCVHLSRDYTAVRAIKRRDYNDSDPFAHDTEHLVSADVGLENMRGQSELRAGQVKCFAMVNLYHSQKHSPSLILRTLRENDEISFSFYPDAHSNGYCAMAGLHGDSLYLHVRRDGKKIAHWELQTSICPSNSARMVQGIPDSESYHNSAIDARKAA